jgi:hypothetical protein
VCRCEEHPHLLLLLLAAAGVSPLQVFYKVLSKRCRRDAPGTQGFVVDVGGNYG